MTVHASVIFAAMPGAKIFQWQPFLAPFHAVVLHFPIGFITMAVVLELYRLRHPSKELQGAIALTLWLSLLSGMVAAFLGIMRAAGGGYDVKLVETHRWVGLSVVFFTCATLVFQRLASRPETRKRWTLLFRAMLFGTLASVVVAGHMGGNLTHGARYLTENAPEFVQEMFDDETPEPTVSTNGLNEKERFFVDKVEPILKNKCLQCHGAEKQKGGLRLDNAEVALKGGKSGKIDIKPGSPMESDLVRRILLPPGDDEIMPPDGKEPPTPEEIVTLVQWIQKGAVFSK